MLDKIGYEVLPNAYFKNINVVSHYQRINDIKPIKMKITGQIILLDNALDPSWSSEDSEIKKFLKSVIRLELNTRNDISMSPPSLVYILDPLDANKAYSFEYSITEQSYIDKIFQENSRLLLNHLV